MTTYTAKPDNARRIEDSAVWKRWSSDQFQDQRIGSTICFVITEVLTWVILFLAEEF